MNQNEKVAEPAGTAYQESRMQALSAPLPVSIRLPERSFGMLAVLVVCAVAAVTFGCPHGDGSTPPSKLPLITSSNPRAEADYRDAEQRLEEGDPDGAESRFRTFLSTYAKDPLVVLAKLNLGRILLARGEPSEALPLFREVEKHSDAVVRDRGRFYEAIALAASGAHAEAVARMRPYINRTIDPEETALLLDTLAKTEMLIGNRAEAVLALDALARSEVPDPIKQDAKRRALALVDEGTDADLARMVAILDQRGIAWPAATKRALRNAFTSSDMARVRELATLLQDHGVDIDDELTAMAVRAEQTEEVDSRAIGAILPLTGRAREVGEDALRGLLLALGLPADGPANKDALRLVFRDDGGDPARTRAAVDELVSTHRVIAIIGPLAGATAQAAAERASELGVPMIALTPTKPAESPWISQLMLSPDAEARDLVGHAVRTGARRFVVAHSESPYGIALANAAEATIRATGAELALRLPYPADTANFAPLAKRVFDANPTAVVVADDAAHVALLAPALAAAGLWPSGTERVPDKARRAVYLLPSAGFDDALLQGSGRYLQGAVFSAPFDAASSTGSARDFTTSYLERFGLSPSLFAASAYDAAHLIEKALRSGANDRRALAERIRGTTLDTAGPSGGLTANGTSRGGTRLLTIVGTRLEPLAATSTAR